MMTLDPVEQFFTDDTDFHLLDDDHLKNNKDSNFFKDTMGLLKRKMCTAQDLLEQFNHKNKEYNDLSVELHETKVDKEKLFNKYNSAREKLTRFELSNKDNEKSRDEYKHAADKQKLELDEKKNYIEQLEFKIKEMEKDSFRLKDEVKKLQQENKISKTVPKKATKNQAIQTLRPQSHNVSVNTDFKKESPKTTAKNKKLIADDLASSSKQRTPILCSKCENQLEFPPLQQILKIMSSPPPPTLINDFSPPCSPRSVPCSSRQSESMASNTFDQFFHENPEPSSFDKKTMERCEKPEAESDRPSFMLIDKLTRKLNNLENLMKKRMKKQKGEHGCQKNCCSSKNIKFVVQLPHEENVFQLAKLARRKQTALKRLNKKQIKSKKSKKLRAVDWRVEDKAEIQDAGLSLQQDKQQSERKYKNFSRNRQTDLFESPAVLVPNPAAINQTRVNPSTSKTISSTLDKPIVHVDSKDNVFEDESETVQSRVNEAVLAHASCQENNGTEAKHTVDGEKLLAVTFNECDLSLSIKETVNSDDDLNTNNFNDNDSIAAESEKSVIVDSENDDTACKSIQEDSDNEAQVVGKSIQGEIEDKAENNSQSRENCEETEGTLSNIGRVSVSSALSFEDDELFSTSPVLTTTDRDSRLDAVKHESEQNSVQEVEMNSATIAQVEVIDPPVDCSSNVESLLDKQMEEQVCENTEENEQSSDDSFNVRCFAATGKKRGKCNNIIDSDEESCDKMPEAENKSKRRKTLMAKKQQLVSKINNLKKISNKPIIFKQAAKVIKPQDHITDTYIPSKKKRVAHVPKDSEVKQVSPPELSLQALEDTAQVQTVEPTNVTTKCKRPKATKKTANSPRKKKKIQSMQEAEIAKDQEKLSTAGLEVTTTSEPTLTAAEPIELTVQHETHANKDDEPNGEDDEVKQIMSENCELDLLVARAEAGKTECTEDSLRTPVDAASSNISTDETPQNEESLDECNKDSVKTSQKRASAKKSPKSRKLPAERPALRVSKRLQEHNPSVTSATTSDTGTDDCAADIGAATLDNKTTDLAVAPPVSSAKKSGKKSGKKKRTKGKKLPFIRTFDTSNSSLPDTTIVSHLNDFLTQENKNQQDDFEPLKLHDKPIREQLSKLMATEPLTTQVLSEVSESLLSVSPVQVVALVMVEYASTEYVDDVKCDATYTPPAPPMTKFEQKFVTLSTRIAEKQPDWAEAIEKGLQYKLFRLGKSQEVQIVERLFRILVILNKIKKDREKVRMLFCDALYCFNTRAMNIIYITLSCWSEVFPKHGSNNDILIKTIVHIIMSSNVNRPFSKLLPLKRLLTDYYGYPNCGFDFRVENFKVELMNNLKENVPGINTAIILLCKSKGAEWTLENIIKGLKHLIVSQAHPSMYDALTLLGNLLRPFSSDTLKSSLEEITNQLCEVLAGNPGSHDLEEGIVSCLLSIGGKFIFCREKIARCVFQWHCNQDLRPPTKEKLNSFLKTHNPMWWRKFVQQNFPLAD